MYSADVPCYAFTSCERFVALRAFKRTLARVGADVPCQVSPLCELFVTIWTLEWTLPRVGADVRCQVFPSCERFVALRTFKWTLARVGADVPCQVFPSCERFVALRAFKRTLARVGADVPCQALLRGSGIFAFRAFKRTLARVGVDVPCQALLRGSGIFAFRAFKRTLARVGVDVPCQVWLVGSLVVAVRTLLYYGYCVSLIQQQTNSAHIVNFFLFSGNQFVFGLARELFYNYHLPGRPLPVRSNVLIEGVVVVMSAGVSASVSVCPAPHRKIRCWTDIQWMLSRQSTDMVNDCARKVGHRTSGGVIQDVRRQINFNNPCLGNRS